MFKLDPAEKRIFDKLSTPQKIQDFLDRLPINHEKRGDTYYSPRQVLREKKAHCMEGALFAAAVLWYHGRPPLLLDLKSSKALKGDFDHVVALFKQKGHWGAISKTNHGVLRYRDPIYKTIRELVLSYFHEYFMNKNGEKTLIAYSKPFSLKSFGKAWVISGEDLWDIADALEASPHIRLIPKGVRLRPASRIERKTGSIIEWKRSHPRT